jgi:diguanylate cyclase (GGDEF)-like protein
MSLDIIRVLAVTGDETIRSMVRDALASPFRGTHFEIYEAETMVSGLDFFEKRTLDCALIDYRLPDGAGQEMVSAVTATGPRNITLILIDVDGDDAGRRALSRGAHDYITRDEMTQRVVARTVCDAVERHLLSTQITELATYDELTQVLTRRHLLERLPQMTALAIRHKYALTLCICDLNQLVLINDRFGNAVGDRVLAHLAQVIKNAVRKEDLIGRFGDDEICVVFSHCTQDQGVGIIQRIRDKFDNHEFYAGLDDRFTACISCGLAEFMPWEKIEQWILRATRALGMAKTDSIIGVFMAESETRPVSDA